MDRYHSGVQVTEVVKVRIWKDIKSGSIQGLVGYFVRTFLTYLFAPSAGVVAILVGWMEEKPLFEIYVGSLASFAFAALILNQFASWLDKRRIRDRLLFSRIRLNRSPKENTLVLGSEFTSDSHMPIEFVVEELRTSIEQKIPERTGFKKSNIEVPPKGGAYFDDHPITLAKFPCNGSLDGHLEMKIRYGPKGYPKYPLTVKKSVLVSFDADRNPISVTCYDED